MYVAREFADICMIYRNTLNLIHDSFLSVNSEVLLTKVMWSFIYYLNDSYVPGLCILFLYEWLVGPGAGGGRGSHMVNILEGRELLW